MVIEYDEAKNAKNVTERGLSFDLVYQLDWQTAQIVEDTRRDYGEIRLRVFGYIEDRLYATVIVRREGIVRVISLRKANKREVKRYEAQAQSRND